MFRPMLFCLTLVLSSVASATGVDFTLQGLDGRKHSLSDYRGKWVVVNYWATWCPPCRDEMPELVSFHEAHKNKDAVVLGVNMDDASREHLLSFVEENMVTYPILLNEPQMTALGPVSGLPTTYLVAPNGSVVAHKTGTVTSENIESFMKSYQP